MSFRYMRVIVLFDLPVITDKDKREYRQFRKFLIKSGYIMMQESVYSKLAQNDTAAETLVDNIRKNKPSSGLVQVLKLTEKQYSRIEYIVGESNSDVITSNERLVIL